MRKIYSLDICKIDRLLPRIPFFRRIRRTVVYLLLVNGVQAQAVLRKDSYGISDWTLSTLESFGSFLLDPLDKYHKHLFHRRIWKRWRSCVQTTFYYAIMNFKAGKTLLMIPASCSYCKSIPSQDFSFLWRIYIGIVGLYSLPSQYLSIQNRMIVSSITRGDGTNV